MLLVQRSPEWLAATLEADDTTLSSKMSGQKDGHDGDSVTESRDVSALSRAGPCAPYEGLVTVGSLRSGAAEFRQRTSQDAIKKLIEALLSRKKLLSTLMTACRTAMNELSAARKRAQQLRDKQREKDLKESSAEKKRTSQTAAAGR